MKWPWVSRLAFDLVKEERDRRITENDQLRNALVAIQRKQSGMTELPKERNAMKPVEIPAEVSALIERYDSEVHRAALKDQVVSLYRGGAPWPEIKTLLEQNVGQGVEEALEAGVR